MKALQQCMEHARFGDMSVYINTTPDNGHHDVHFEQGGIEITMRMTEENLGGLGHFLTRTGMVMDGLLRGRCTCCSGTGEVGGFVNAESGYQTDECPHCKGTGLESRQEKAA